MKEVEEHCERRGRKEESREQEEEEKAAEVSGLQKK